MSNEPNNTDQELEDYLNGKSAISDIYAESKTVAAPDKLCVDIKAMARAEVAKEKSTSRWFVPLSLVATIVLSFSVYLLLIRQPVVTDIPQLVIESTEKIPADIKATARAEVTEEQVTVVTNEKHEIPAHIKDLLQTTAKRSDKEVEEYPTAKELKAWAVANWVKKIKQLQADGRQQQADRYIRDFKKYHPELDIERILKEQ